jgi:hypothetical protein
MEHVTLNDKTVLRSPQQAGVKFLELHNASLLEALVQKTQKLY